MCQNHNQWWKVMQGGLEQLRRYAAAASAPAKRSKFSSKLYTSACSFIHSGHFTRFSVHIKLYTFPPIQRAIQKMFTEHCSVHISTLRIWRQIKHQVKQRKRWMWNDKKEEILTNIVRRRETKAGEGRVHLARPPDETEEVVDRVSMLEGLRRPVPETRYILHSEQYVYSV